MCFRTGCPLLHILSYIEASSQPSNICFIALFMPNSMDLIVTI